jgi:nickel superoxide dismutase
MLSEHVTTIEKSMKQIAELAGEKELNYNQIVRWVSNKEQHANELQHIVTQYFMTQRIKPADEKDAAAAEDYRQKLVVLHQMLVYAMKAKQTTDLANVEKLRALIDQFRTLYFGQAGHGH